MGCLPSPHKHTLKNEVPLQLKSKGPFQEMIPRKKKKKKSESIINNCVSLIKQHWKKMTEIPHKRGFLLTWSIQKFVRKYYIT